MSGTLALVTVLVGFGSAVGWMGCNETPGRERLARAFAVICLLTTGFAVGYLSA